MEALQFDLTTAAGIAGLATVLVQIIKTQFFNKDWASFGIICNVTTVALSFGLSFGYMMITDDLTAKQALANGMLGAMTALGGYESVKNFVISLLKPK